MGDFSYNPLVFTGIIEATAVVRRWERESLTIDRPATFDDIRVGSSISVAGVCLSVTAFDATSMTFDVTEETLERTRFGSLHTGDRLNLERAMRADSRFDGHMVQGHVEGVGTVHHVTWKESGDAWSAQEVLTVDLPANLRPSIVSKGSVALDGVSLTIAAVDRDRMTVALIPHTLQHTTLGMLVMGDRVNVETDVLVRSALESRRE